jgi:hypothetical protein
MYLLTTAMNIFFMNVREYPLPAVKSILADEHGSIDRS